MNWVIPQSFGAISKRFRETPIENTLAAGITASFGVISYKGKVWAVRHRGNTTHILAENGRDPAYSIEICLLKSSPAVSKTFYETTYVEGSNEPPACMATNGVIPDAGVPKKQAPACAICPNNAWGSRRTPDGKNAKACADNKRLAVVLMPNMLDETFGGPLLLRVPPASLQDLANFGNQLAQHGYHEHSIVTRVAFDMKEAYPRFVFSPVRPLSDGEADVAIDLRQSAEVSRILAEALEYVSPAEQRETFFEQPPKAGASQTVAQRAMAARQARPVSRTLTLTPAVPASPEPSSPREPIGQSEPTTVREPTTTSEPLARREPRSVSEPKSPREPSEASEPLNTREPSGESEPSRTREPSQTSEPQTPREPKQASDMEGIPAFLRKEHKDVAEEDDDAFLDEIDSKLAAMLPG